MIRTNDSSGIMAMHYAKEKLKPKEPDPTLKEWQLTVEEMIRYQAMKPPSTKDPYKTTAHQRPIRQEKPKFDIWAEKEE